MIVHWLQNVTHTLPDTQWHVNATCAIYRIRDLHTWGTYSWITLLLDLQPELYLSRW